MDVSVGIVTHNRRDQVLEAIASVHATAGGCAFEIVVVDNASEDGTPEAIRERFPDVQLIRLPENIGCPSGRNVIYAHCGGDYIINLDDDGRLEAGAIQGIVEMFDEDPRIGIIALRQAFTGERGSGRSVGPPDRVAEVGRFWGGVSAFRRSMLEEIGSYPEDLFLYYEESFLALRAMDAGYRIVSNPQLVMWHPRIGGSRVGSHADYYRYRNGLLLASRLFPLWMLLPYFLFRLGHFGLASLKSGSFREYLRAVGSALMSLPRDLPNRTPCSFRAVWKYHWSREHRSDDWPVGQREGSG